MNVQCGVIVFYSSYTTASYFYPFVVTIKIMQRLWNKWDPVIAIIVAIKSSSLTNLTKHTACNVTEKLQSSLSWKHSSEKSLQLYLWLLRGSNTGDSFSKALNIHIHNVVHADPSVILLLQKW